MIAKNDQNHDKNLNMQICSIIGIRAYLAKISTFVFVL